MAAYETNYVPEPEGNVPTGGAILPVEIINGAPTGPGFPGYIRIDEDTGDFYEYVNGAWTLAFNAGGGGGATEVFALAGSATPAATPTGGGVSYNEIGQVWVYSGGSWVLTIS